MGPERLEKGVGFVAYVFHESFVFRGILARGLKLSPQPLDEDQTLASFVQGGPFSHDSTAVCPEVRAWKSRVLAYIRGSTFTS